MFENKFDIIRFVWEHVDMNKSAQRLGRLGKGVKKQLTQVERQRRRDFMLGYNARRKVVKV